MHRTHRSLFLLINLLASFAIAQEPASTEHPAAATGTTGMVSSAHPLATEAGLRMLRVGGNAFDAAVAVASTLNVVEPMMSGMGGYGTIMVYSAETDTPWFLDASGKIPVGVDPDVYRAPTPNYLENRVGAKALLVLLFGRELGLVGLGRSLLVLILRHAPIIPRSGFRARDPEQRASARTAAGSEPIRNLA